MAVEWLTTQEKMVDLLLGTVLHIMLFLLVAMNLLRHRREAASATAWLLFSWFVPFGGFICYFLLGRNVAPVKARRKRIRDQALLAHRRENETLEMSYWRAVRETQVADPPTPEGVALNHALDGIGEDFPLLGGNCIRMLLGGDVAYGPMLEAIRHAQHHIHLQSFIIARDQIGTQFMDALAERAKAGVAVRVLVDRFGSSRAVLTGFFRRYRRLPNFQVVGWTQSNFFKRQFAINLRNHRKLLIIDGTQAFTGGLNLHDENRSADGQPPGVRDYHFHVRGPAVQELQFSFLQDWHYMSGEAPTNLLKEALFPHQREMGAARIRVFNGGPLPGTDAMNELFFQTIHAARERLWAVTPYFTPTPDLLHALKAAVRRDVDVRLLVPARNNHIYAGLAGRSLYEELLAAGVRVFATPSPFLHAKAMIADHNVALIGSANLDVRSLRLNYETVLTVYDDLLLSDLAGVLSHEMACSQEINLDRWRARPLTSQVLENACNLFTPIL